MAHERVYFDLKTNTRYTVLKKGYNISNNEKYIYLKRINDEIGTGPQVLQFSVRFFDLLIIKGDFITI